jgi:hypothetical protein
MMPLGVLQRHFTQTDPMPMGAGSSYESTYVYGRNNPNVYVDPSGLRGVVGGLSAENQIRDMLPGRYLDLSTEAVDRKRCLPKQLGCMNNGDLPTVLAGDLGVASRARSWALSMPGIDGGTGPGNARQHLYFSIGMTVAVAAGKIRSVETLETQARKASMEALRILDRHENIYGGSVKGPMDGARTMDLVNNNLGVSITPGIMSAWQQSHQRRWACAYYELEGIAQGFCYGNPFAAFVRGYVERETSPGGRAVWL